jgi:hypothetical protein
MFNIEYVKDLKWCDVEHTMFECVVKYAEFNEEMPAGINGADPYPHTQEIWAKGNAGDYGVIAEYVPPPEPEPLAVASDENQPTTAGTQTL